MVNSQLAVFNFERKYHNLIVNHVFFFIKLFSKLLGSYKAHFSVTLFGAQKYDYRIFVSLFTRIDGFVCASQHLPPFPWNQYLT